MLFDAKILKEKVTRDDMNSTEDFISSMMQSKFESIQKLSKLMEQIKKH